MKDPLATQSKLWVVARTLFLLTVTYAVLVDLPIAIENIIHSRTPTYHLVTPGFNVKIPWIKIGKDLLFLGSMLCVMFIVYQEKWQFPALKSSPIFVTFLLLVLIIAILFVTGLILGDFLIAIIGVRAHLAILAFVLGVYLREVDINKTWKFLKYLFILQVGFSIWAAAVYPNPISRQQFRITGTFNNPNTLGLFSVIVIVFLFVARISDFQRWLFWGISILLIIATGSRTSIAMAMLVSIIYLFVSIRQAKYRLLILAIILLCAPFIPLLLEWVSGRPDAITQLFNIDYRLGATWNYLVNAEPLQVLLGEGIGRGSNLLLQLDQTIGVSPVSGYDNLLGSEIVQGGAILLIITLTFFASPLLRFSNNFLSLALPALVLVASIGIPLWEVWPSNILIMALYGHLCSAYRDSKY